jgi:hypothetical protein
MLESGISNIAMFFVIVGAAVIFVAAWVVKSETRVNAARGQIKSLKLRLEAGERERYMLAERIAAAEDSARVPQESSPAKESSQKEKTVSRKKYEEVVAAKEALADENKKLKTELAEATASLAEVYKALCEK